MNEYEAKQQRRKARLTGAADRAQANSDAHYTAAHEAVAHIPFGQPILVGHHSERRHRNTLARSHRHMDKFCEEADRAKELQAKAAAVGTGGVSSDDPNALDKLRKKLEGLEAAHGHMKVINKALRGGKTQEERVAALVALGYTEAQVTGFMKKNFAGRVGFPTYALSNSNANIRRVRERIAVLEAAQGHVYREHEHGDLRIVEDPDANRIKVLFPDKPSAEIRAELKSRGFRFAFNDPDMPWQRHLNNAGLSAVRTFLSWYDAQA